MILTLIDLALMLQRVFLVESALSFRIPDLNLLYSIRRVDVAHSTSMPNRVSEQF